MLRNQRTGDPLFLVVSFLILALTLAGALSVCSRRAADPVDGVRLLSPGLVPTVYIPRAASPAEREAAEDLARVLRIMGAAEVEVRPEPWFSGQPGIYVGDTQMARERLPDVVAPSPSLDANGECNPFTSLETRRGPIPPERWDTLGIHAGDGVLVLAGPDPEASALAVYHVLQRHGGVRWWIPGPLGESIPRRELWFVPGMDQRVRPSFLSRSFSGVPGSGGEGRLWARRNLLREHASFSHNLQKLLPGSHAAERPDLFPLVDGRRPEAGVVPAMNLHPDLSNPQVAAAVAAAAGRFFDARPDAASFSLSPGDHLGFGDLEQYGALVDTRTGFRGMADLSPLIFSFYNDVARRVARRYPDRLLGGLSYYAWENVPPFPVEPNVLPYLTADRSQWYDPEFKRSDLDLVSRWAAAGPRHIGTWDYIYGREFIVPRVELAVIKESIPALYERGVRFYFAELNPVWGFDAPKAWIAARLLWDAHADPEALEREFFLGSTASRATACAVFSPLRQRVDGPAATRPLDQVLQGPGPRRAIPRAPLVAELRAQVMRANAEAGSEAVRDRVQLTVDALDATKALSVLLPLQYAVARWAPGQPPAALLDLVEPYRAAGCACRQPWKRGTDSPPSTTGRWRTIPCPAASRSCVPNSAPPNVCAWQGSWAGIQQSPSRSASVDPAPGRGIRHRP
jgi:hypothetical protein